MSSPIRVFHLIKSLGRGGAEMLLPVGLRVADRERFTYAYGYFLPSKNAMVGELQELGADVVCFGGKGAVSLFMRARKVAAHLRAWKADVVHCHLPIAGVLGRVAGHLAGVPVVYTEHCTMEDYRPLTRRLNLMTWNWQQRVIAVSGDVANSIQGHVQSRVPVDVVLNGVDVNHFNPDGCDGADIRRKLNIPGNAPIVSTVAVFRKQKKLDDWLAAAKMLRERFPAARFILVGDGPLREELLELARSYGIAHAVHLVGLQDDVRPYLAASNLYMMSSAYEGLPVALLEAMSMGLPVVATEVGGIPEVIQSGENGVLVPAGQPLLLAQRAADLLAGESRQTELGAAARKTIDLRFSIRRMVGQLEPIYVEMLNGKAMNRKQPGNSAVGWNGTRAST